MGLFDELCFFIQENYLKIQLVFEDENWNQLEMEYVRHKFQHRNDYLYCNPNKKKEESPIKLAKDFRIVDDKFNSLVEKNKQLKNLKEMKDMFNQ